MARVTEEQVRGVTGDGEEVDASQAIEVATLIVTEELGNSDLSEDRLKQVELYLAAHFQTLATREGPLAAQTVGETSERYHNIYAAGLRSTRFGQQVILLDTTGAMAEMAARAETPTRLPAQFSVI